MALSASSPGGPVSRPVLSHALEAVLAAAGIGVWETDLDSGEHIWGDHALALYGLPPGARAPSFDEWRTRFLHPEDRERVAARAAEMASGGRPYEVDYRIRRPDGEVRWLHTRAAYAPGSRRLVGISIDITERKDTELRAGEALKVLDLSASYVGFGIGYRDADSDMATWGAQLKMMLGFDPAGPTPTREQFFAVVEPEFRERVREQSAQALEVGLFSDFEFAIRRPSDGQHRMIMVRTLVIGDSAQRPVRRYFAMVDVTEARERERQLAELLERLQQATEASGIGTWERDAITGAGHWDDTALALVNMPPGSPALSIDQLMAIVHPDDRQSVLQQWQRMDATGEAADMQYRLVMPDGTIRWLQSRGRSHLDANGRVLRRSGICYDISERHAAEEAREQRALAERANAAKTEFLSRMSHELRTPLNAVLGFSQLMTIDAQDPLTPRQRERVEHILAAGWHLLALINDVLDLTRIEARQLQIEMTEVDLAELFAQSAAMNEVAAHDRAVTLTVVPLPPGCERVWADATRLRQLLLNLLSNAVKYNVRGGKVTLSARAAGEAQVEILVTDTGLGMSAAQLAQLFQPFNRLGREHSGVEGSGIGLIVAKLLAEQMGGRLEVESRAGAGSTFRVVLAARPVAAAAR